MQIRMHIEKFEDTWKMAKIEREKVVIKQIKTLKYNVGKISYILSIQPTR